MTIKNRLNKLEARHSSKTKNLVYFSDPEKGYAATATGEYFQTFEALAEAQGWEVSDRDTVINVTYASEPSTAICMPDNKRETQTRRVGVDFEKL